MGEPVKMTVVKGADVERRPEDLALEEAAATVALAREAARGTRRNVALLKRRQRHAPRSGRAFRGIVGAPRRVWR